MHLIPYYERARIWQDLRQWWPGETPWDIAVSAVLTQNIQWERAFQALRDLHAAGIRTPRDVIQTTVEELAAYIRRAGGYRRKARTLHALARFVFDRCAGDITHLRTWPVESARQALRSIHGIGPETADAILLYACQAPVMVVDAYTVRILQRHGLLPPGTWQYDYLYERISAWVPADVSVLQEIHAQMVVIGKTFCRPDRPSCDACPWASLLPLEGPQHR